MLIFQCILGFQSQSADLTNAFSQAYIPSEELFYIELPMDFMSDGVQLRYFSFKRFTWMSNTIGR